MSSSLPSLKRWIMLYISQQQAYKSRYDIDRYLLENGIDPQLLEATWQHLAPKPIETRSQRLRKASKEWEWRLLLGVVVFVGLALVIGEMLPHIFRGLYCLPFTLMSFYTTTQFTFWFWDYRRMPLVIATCILVLATIRFGFMIFS